jgi:hypothetical protein
MTRLSAPDQLGVGGVVADWSLAAAVVDVVAEMGNCHVPARN